MSGVLAFAGALTVAGVGGVLGAGSAAATTPQCEPITAAGVYKCSHPAFMKFKLKNHQELTLCITPEGRTLRFPRSEIAEIVYQYDANPAHKDCKVR